MNTKKQYYNFFTTTLDETATLQLICHTHRIDEGAKRYR